MELYIVQHIWTFVKMVMFDKNHLFIFRLIRYIYNFLFESSCVWWMEVNNSYIHIVHLHTGFCYANTSCSMSHLHVDSRTWHCKLWLVVDGSFFIMLVHPRPIMQWFKREKSEHVRSLFRWLNRNLSLFAKIYRTFRVF